MIPHRKLSIMIINWNTKDLLQACLRSLYEDPQQAFEVIVVDNHSTDGSLEMLRETFPQVEAISNTTNRGFAAAVNQAIPLSRGQCVLLLNPDTVILKGAIDRLLDFLESHPRAGAVGPQLLNLDGSVQRRGLYRRHPTIPQVCLFYTCLRFLAQRRRTLVARYWEHIDHTVTQEVDQIPGACCLVRRKVIEEVGLLDERFFLYFEDVDWCYRIRRHGWKLYFAPQAMVIHYVAGSTSQLLFPSRRWMLTKGLVLFFWKHRGAIAACLVASILLLNLLIECLGALATYPWIPSKRLRQRQIVRETFEVLSARLRWKKHASQEIRRRSSGAWSLL